MSDLTIATAAPAGAAVTTLPAARGPWSTAFRKLRQDRAAMAALLLLALIVAACVLAPVFAAQVAQTDPFSSNVDGTISVGGQDVPVMQPEEGGLGLGLTPIGPTWRGQYFLGSDAQGRDVMARLLYGGRNSLLIAGVATLICLPIYLLAISLSIVLISQGIQIGPITISSNSIALPILIIGIVYVPYVARPIRGQVLSLKRSDFVLAAKALGVPPLRILLRDILPNISTTLIVFAPLMMALNMLTESALSFLSIGVQPPEASWGTIIEDGQSLIYTRPLVAIAGGLAIVITVLALNVLGDGVRDALDPKAKLRVGAK